MFEFAALRAYEMEMERRRMADMREVRAARAATARVRQARVRQVAGAAIVALGQRVAGKGEWIAQRSAPVEIRASGDCA
jgi:hypothetical protein